jgi:hypothetical protein
MLGYAIYAPPQRLRLPVSILVISLLKPLHPNSLVFIEFSQKSVWSRNSYTGVFHSSTYIIV